MHRRASLAERFTGMEGSIVSPRNKQICPLVHLIGLEFGRPHKKLFDASWTNYRNRVQVSVLQKPRNRAPTSFRDWVL